MLEAFLREIGEGVKPPRDVPPSEELPADPDGSLRAASEAATAKALGLDLEDIEVRTRRLVKPESAVEPSTPSPRRVRATQVPKREEHENHIGPPGLNVAYDLASKNWKRTAVRTKELPI